MTSDAFRPEFDRKILNGVLATSKLRPASIVKFMGYLGVFVGYTIIFMVSLLTIGFLEIRQANMGDFNALIAMLDERDRYIDKYKDDQLSKVLDKVDAERLAYRAWIDSPFCLDTGDPTAVPGNASTIEPATNAKTCAEIKETLRRHANELASTEDEVRFRLANLPFYYDQYKDGIAQKTPQIIPALRLLDSKNLFLTVWARSPFELIEMFLLVCMGLLGGVINVMRYFVDPSLKNPAIAEFFYKPAAGAAISLGVYVLFRAAQIFLGVQSGPATVSTSVFLLAGLGLASGFCATAALAQIEFVATRLLRSSGPDANRDNQRGAAADREDGPGSGPAAAAPTPG